MQKRVASMFRGTLTVRKETPMNQTTRITESTRTEAVLHMALELGASEWKLGFGVEAGRKASQRTVAAGDLNGPRETSATLFSL